MKAPIGCHKGVGLCLIEINVISIYVQNRKLFSVCNYDFRLSRMIRVLLKYSILAKTKHVFTSFCLALIFLLS